MPYKKFRYRKGQKTTPRERANKFANKLAKEGKHPIMYKATKKWTKRGWVNYDTWIVQW